MTHPQALNYGKKIKNTRANFFFFLIKRIFYVYKRENKINKISLEEKLLSCCQGRRQIFILNYFS
jgi:hypothetical protein